MSPPPEQQRKHLCDSEGAEGLSAFYWSKFAAPERVAAAMRRSRPERLQRRLPCSHKVLRCSRNEHSYYMEPDENTLLLLGTPPPLPLWTSTARMQLIGIFTGFT